MMLYESAVDWCWRGLASSWTVLENLKASEIPPRQAMGPALAPSMRLRTLYAYAPPAVAAASSPVAMILLAGVWNGIVACDRCGTIHRDNSLAALIDFYYPQNAVITRMSKSHIPHVAMMVDGGLRFHPCLHVVEDIWELVIWDRPGRKRQRDGGEFKGKFM